MALSCAALLCAACASLGEGEPGGGGSNLPNRGVAGYAIVTLDEDSAPVGLELGHDANPNVRSPSALVVDARVVLYFEARSDDDTSRVLRTESDDGEAFSAPAEVLADGVASGGPRSPAVARLRDGRWRLVFGVADGSAIYAIDSSDGLAFDMDTLRVVLAPEGFDEQGGVGEPSLVVDDAGRQVLFYQARSGDERPLTTIRRAVLEGDAPAARAPVLAPGTGCVTGSGAQDVCWDASVVGAPEVRLARDSLGRRIWRLSYAGGQGAQPSAIGFAFSFDGLSWSRYPYNPALKNPEVLLDAPSNVRLGERYLLYVTLVEGDTASIALAVSGQGPPTETIE